MELIQHAETIPLSDDNLREMLGKDSNRVKVMLYEDLKGYQTLQQLLPNKYDAAIILLQIEAPGAPKVGHWITVMNHGSHFEHFDSYGMDPDEELATTHEDSHITNLISNSNTRVITSQAKLQARKEAVNTCGRWAIVRSRFPKLEKQEFVQFIRSVHSIPDVAVTLLTYLLL
jgi:hypothetical protein